MPLSPGQVLNNRYRIVSLLGQGGFGAVYRAWDTNLDEPVAIKESVVTSPAAQKQFQLEAKLLFKLRHPNLPVVHDVFIIPGQGMYLVMDFVEGEDLQEMLLRVSEPLQEAQVLAWIGQVCEALEYLHSQNPPIIHRDIKPANIKITPQGKAMLVDFGIAKVYDPKLNTAVGARAITPGYSPQEQYGAGITDARTDVYALGATLYHLLTGRQPPESIQRNIEDTLTPLRALNPSVSIGTDKAVSKAMEPHPSQRFHDMAEFRASLITKPTSAVQKSTHDRLIAQTIPTLEAQPIATSNQGTAAVRKPARPLPWKWFGGALGILAVVIVLLIVFYGGASETTGQSSTQTTLVLAITQMVEPNTTASATFDGAGAPIETQESSPVTTDTLVPSSTTTVSPSDTATPTATAESTALPPQIVDKFGVSMALVPSGAFEMGIGADIAFEECKRLNYTITCKLNWFSDAEPAHTIYLDDYYIDITEVTNVMYEQCVRADACSPPSQTDSSSYNNYYGSVDYADYPVIFVDWDQASAYCEWRGARLPTEAEWEKAARGTDKRLYPWGDDFGGDKTNFCDRNCQESWANEVFDDGYADTAPVGRYLSAASPYGVLDMAGNVWEWTSDWYDEAYYRYSPYENPEGPETGQWRVVRGGSWYDSIYYLGTAFRETNYTTDTRGYIGFRCALSP